MTFGQVQESVTLRVDALLQDEDYSNGKNIIAWQLSNNSVITNEIPIGEMKEGDTFKIHFTGTETEANMVVNAKITLSFLDNTITTEDTFPGFVEFLRCMRTGEEKWIIF
jgi:hypothetical protein